MNITSLYSFFFLILLEIMKIINGPAAINDDLVEQKFSWFIQFLRSYN